MGQRLLAAAAVLAVLALGLQACADDGTGSDGRPSVVATTTQVADLARNVAGDRAQVEGMLDAGSDPHDYEPRPSDARELAEAALVLRSGGELDEWLDEVIANAGGDAETVTLLDAVGGGREGDPHWWHDPRKAVRAVRRIRDALIDVDPGGRGAYEANAARYARVIAAADRTIAACFAAVPASRRKLVTNHDALGLFADRYDIEVIGTVIPARSTQAQASAGGVARLARTIRAEDVRVIFPESSLSAELERAIARESGARVGPGLYADALGPEGTPEATYLGALRANVDAMVAAFTDGARGCES